MSPAPIQSLRRLSLASSPRRRGFSAASLADRGRMAIQTIIVTGGAGFIGSNFVRYLLARYPEYRVHVLDSLTYAGNLENLADVSKDPRFEFTQGDIRDAAAVEAVASRADAIINFAAESHVDRSILNPGAFIQTD